MTEITRQMINVINELGRRHFSSILDYFRIRYNDRGVYLNGRCPIPSHPGDGDNESAFSFRYDIGIWSCFSQHCNNMFGSDVVGFVRGMLECDFIESVKWLKTFLSKKINVDIDAIDVDDFDIPERTHQIVIHKPLPESLLKYLGQHNYLVKRGFDSEIVDRYEVGYWEHYGSLMHECIIFPIRDVENRLVAFTGRSVWEKDEWKRKYPNRKYKKWLHSRHYMKRDPNDRFHASSVLYNLNNVKGNYNSLILVEGVLDGFKLSMSGIPNWVCIFGSSLSPTQRYLLFEANIKQIILAFDSDKAGRRCTDRTKQILSGFGGSITEVKVPFPYDIGDLNPATVKELFNDK